MRVRTAVNVSVCIFVCREFPHCPMRSRWYSYWTNSRWLLANKHTNTGRKIHLLIKYNHFLYWLISWCVDSAGDILIFHNDVQTRLYLCDSSGCITLFMAIILRESIANSLIKICLNGLHYGLNVEPLFFSAKFSWQRNYCIQGSLNSMLRTAAYLFSYIKHH